MLRRGEGVYGRVADVQVRQKQALVCVAANGEGGTQKLFKEIKVSSMLADRSRDTELDIRDN